MADVDEDCADDGLDEEVDTTDPYSDRLAFVDADTEPMPPFTDDDDNHDGATGLFSFSPVPAVEKVLDPRETKRDGLADALAKSR